MYVFVWLTQRVTSAWEKEELYIYLCIRKVSQILRFGWDETSLFS